MVELVSKYELKSSNTSYLFILLAQNEPYEDQLLARTNIDNIILELYMRDAI